MPDIFKDTDTQLETLSMYKVLEGLIHNINTPLNVVIGYAQQLHKQNPDLPFLESITEAGLQIDDLVQAASRQFMQRLNPLPETFEIRQWMLDEQKLLRNVLELKHTFRLETDLIEQRIPVISHAYLLSGFVEGLVLFVRKNAEFIQGENRLLFSLEDTQQAVNLIIKLPKCESLQTTMEPYLSHLQNLLESASGILFKPDFPFSWQYNPTNEVRISLTKAEEA